MEKKDWKKVLRGIALLFALAGSVVLLVFTFMINDALDRTEKSVVGNIEGIQGTLLDIENAVDKADQQLNATSRTLQSLEASFTPISEGLDSTGAALAGMSQTLSGISLLGVNLGAQAAELEDAANSMFEASGSLEDTNFDEHTENVGELQLSLQSIKDDIRMQRQTLGETKRSVEEVIGLMKIANVLLFFVIISMFIVLMLNSTAGLI